MRPAPRSRRLARAAPRYTAARPVAPLEPPAPRGSPSGRTTRRCLGPVALAPPPARRSIPSRLCAPSLLPLSLGPLKIAHPVACRLLPPPPRPSGAQGEVLVPVQGQERRRQLRVELAPRSPLPARSAPAPRPTAAPSGRAGPTPSPKTRPQERRPARSRGSPRLATAPDSPGRRSVHGGAARCLPSPEGPAPPPRLRPPRCCAGASPRLPSCLRDPASAGSCPGSRSCPDRESRPGDLDLADRLRPQARGLRHPHRLARCLLAVQARVTVSRVDRLHQPLEGAVPRDRVRRQSVPPAHADRVAPFPLRLNATSRRRPAGSPSCPGPLGRTLRCPR